MKEDKHPFVESTTYADDIKYKGGGYQGYWHYINIPYLDEAGTVGTDFKFKPKSHDIVEAINAITAWIDAKDNYKTSYVY